MPDEMAEHILKKCAQRFILCTLYRLFPYPQNLAMVVQEQRKRPRKRRDLLRKRYKCWRQVQLQPMLKSGMKQAFPFLADNVSEALEFDYQTHLERFIGVSSSQGRCQMNLLQLRVI